MSSGYTRALGSKLSLREWDAKKIIEGGSVFTGRKDGLAKMDLLQMSASPSNGQDIYCGGTPIPHPP